MSAAPAEASRRRRAAASAPQMVLPAHERASGEITTARWPHSRDERVPYPLRTSSEDYFSEEHPVGIACRSYDFAGPCATGRHLFDLLESTVWREVERPDGEWVEECDFRTRLTCVRCGQVTEWEGTRTERRVTQLDPVPLVVAGFVAQHVGGHGPVDRWRTLDLRRWDVFRDEQLVGHLSGDRTPRGRVYYAATLDEWPQGEHVEGTTPEAALRALARTTHASVAAHA